MHGVEAVHAEVTQQRLEEVVLRCVLQQVRGDAVSGDLETGLGHEVLLKTCPNASLLAPVHKF